MLKWKIRRILEERLLLLLLIFIYTPLFTSATTFYTDQTIGCSPLHIQFTSSTIGAVSWQWDLGNGNTSTLANPTNVYTMPGTYTVKLKTTDGSGNSDSLVITNYITVVAKPLADFNTNATTSCPDFNQFNFNNTSTGATTYLWDFGDGTTSTIANPTHSFTYAGTFSVTLVAKNAYGCQDIKIIHQLITIHPKPDANFTVDDSSSCDPATQFQFHNSAQNGATWNWSFGDQSNSGGQNPVHTYAGQGFYPVSLIVTNTFGCSDTSDIPVNIRVGFKDWADFTHDIDSGCAPLKVHFTNTNSNLLTSTWDFGDGTSSALLSADHTYTAGGTYSVTLIVTTTNGCTDTVFKSNLVSVGIMPTTNFTYSNSSGCAPLGVQFTNTSSNYTNCVWYFGDGTSSTVANPNHLYTNGGTYTVTLQCWGGSGCSSSSMKQNIIHVTQPKGQFSATQRIGCPPLSCSFSAFSQTPNVSYHWNFGDGSTSTLQNPTHVYNSSGAFDVLLVITDQNGCTDSILKNDYVQTVNSAANYVPPPVTSGCAPLTAQFSCTNLGAVSWFWDFGDGTTSTLSNPTHNYIIPGLYNVSLTTTYPGGGCSQTINNYSTFNIKGGYAGFSHTSTPCPPFITTFQDTSLNAASWFWEYDDGETDTIQNPSHTFEDPGYHSASLTITTVDGCVYHTMHTNGIYFAPFAASYYGIPIGSTFPMSVQFYANSVGATGWLWDFGDSTFSTLENPIHTYQIYRPYDLTLTIYNASCTLTYVPPPYFFGPGDTTAIGIGNNYVFILQEGCAPLNVAFTKKVPASVSWHWDFGDGDTSNIEFPHHLYFVPGFYDVSLTTVDTSGATTTLVMDSIVHAWGPIAGFDATTMMSCANTDVVITDTSKYAVSWKWDFGDGTAIDTIQNPFHAYPSSVSNFVVTQMLSDTDGCNANLAKSVFTSVNSPPLASETNVCGQDTIYFYTSFWNYTSYLWDFGDGTTSTQINPAHAYSAEGTYDVTLTITDNIGCVHTFHVTQPIKVNLPTADFSTPSQRKGCNMLNITFVNQSQNADSYLWNFGDGNSSMQVNPVHNYLTAGFYDVSLTVYRGSCTMVKSFPQYIEVDTPHAEFSIHSNQLCLPITSTFTDLSANPVAWRWYFGDGDSSAIQNPLHTYDNRPGLFPYLIMTDNNGCIDTVYSPSFPVLQARFTPSADSGCYPVTIHFYNESSPMATSWEWYFGDGGTSTQQNPDHTYTQPGEYDIMLIIHSTYVSCPDTLFIPKKIKIREPHSDFVSTDIPSCAPSIVTFTNQSADAGNYVWDFGDGGTSNNANPTHIYNTPGIYDVNLIALNGLGCSDTITKQHYITVLGPITNFSASNLQGCSPLIVDFTDHSINAVAYSWNFGDGYSDSLTNVSHTFLDSGSFTVSLVTKDTAGCISFYELPQKVEILPKPNTSFTVDTPGGCIPFTANFTNTSTDYQSLIWNFMDGDTSAMNNPSHLFTTAGQYDVILVAYNQFGCADTAHLAQPLAAVPLPTPSFSTNDTLGCFPLHVTFANHSTNLEGPQYLWDFGNGDISTAVNPEYDFLYPGSFDITLTITNAFGCSSSVTYYSMIKPQDSIPPTVTNIMSVSVMTDTSVKIIWANNPTVDLKEYRLFRLDPQFNMYKLIYTLLNDDNTNFALTSEYTDHGLNTLQYSYTYKIQTIDICGNTIPLDSSIAHTTINISSQQFGEDIFVNWTPYDGCPVNSYELYRAAPGEQFQYLTSLPPSASAYTDSSFDCPVKYTYRVMATDLCGNTYTSYSDTSSITPVNSLADQVVDVVRSTVYENQSVLTEWLLPVVHPEKVAQFDLYRSTDNINFSYLQSLPSIQTDFMDYNVDVQTTHYYYKILVVNTCNIAEDLSGNTSTIVLKGEMDELRQVHLEWTPYNGWENGVDYYILEKKDELGHWQILKQVNASTLFYDYNEH